MAKLTNSPAQTLNFDWERRKSYMFQVQLRHAVEGTPVNLTGSTLRFVMKDGSSDDDPFDLLNHIVHNTAQVLDPASGVASFSFQAAELDAPTGEYPYSIVLWSPEGFSTLLAKGVVNLLDNTEAHSMHRMYAGLAPVSAIELQMRAGDVVQIIAPTLPIATVPEKKTVFPVTLPASGVFSPDVHDLSRQELSTVVFFNPHGVALSLPSGVVGWEVAEPPAIIEVAGQYTVMQFLWVGTLWWARRL